MASVGIRSLQQHASAVIARVQAGEIIDVTDRGRLVARLVPTQGGALQQLTDAGLIRPATRELSELPPPLTLAPGETTAGSILAEMRDNER